MANLIGSISKIFKGASSAFKKYPVVIVNALAFSIVTIIRIHLDWPEQEAYNFLFNCLHLSFALGAIFSLAAITAAQSKYNTKKAFKVANSLGIIGTMMTLVLLYFFGGVHPEYSALRYKWVSSLATARVSVGIFVSLLMFITLAGDSEKESDFPKSLFMVHKSFVIALIYGLVIMSGTSAVAGAVKALLYKGLSSKVYGYIGTLSGFLAFTIFVGYFPDFRKGTVDQQREIAEKQPRFMEILFGYIMVPITLALTLVLILWSIKTTMEGMKVSFIRLSSIASSYGIIGIWLHTMVTHYETDMAKFYKRIYPIAAICILAFEAWALVAQLQKYGLKTTEYLFILIWLATLSSVILLITKKEKAHHIIVIIISILAIISVVPYVGYNDLPVKTQVSRLERLLEKEGMIKENTIVPAITEPERNMREAITDAVEYLANTEDAKLPQWFDKDFRNTEKFKNIFGFNKTFPQDDDIKYDYLGTNLFLQQEVIDIKDYRWAINMQSRHENENGYVTVEGDKGKYKVYWEDNRQDGIPSLKILLEEKPIVQSDMNQYLDRITEKFPPGKGGMTRAILEDMSVVIETPELEIMIIFDNVDINIDTSRDRINYWINPNTLYMNEK